MTQDIEKFDLNIVHDKFKAALHEEDDIDLELYLESFSELNKFFTLLGSFLSFVSSEIKSKIQILVELLQKEDTSQEYKTVKRMIEYEKNNNLLKKDGFTSGCRTLLRIHRGLEFMQLFLKKIGDLRDEDGTAAPCRESYNETLSKHHTFLIRQGAKLAMYSLPTRNVLLQKVCGDSENVERAMNILPDTLEVCAVVYDRVDDLYTKNDLHSLP